MSEFEKPRSGLATLWQTIARIPRAAGRGLIKVYRYTLSPLTCACIVVGTKPPPG